MYEFLSKEEFRAHDAIEDSLTLARILFKSKCKSLENKLSEIAFRWQYLTEVEERSPKCTLETLPISNFMKDKRAKEDLDNNTLINVQKSGGVKGRYQYWLYRGYSLRLKVRPTRSQG